MIRFLVGARVSCLFFFFSSRRRHTRFDCDWSSDVCSSDLLAEGGRTLLYYDQRGGGRSPVPRDVLVGWREHVADLEALRGHWELDRLTVIGYSWGGLLALLYALEHPDRIARLALVSSAPVTAALRHAFARPFAARLGPPWSC